MSNPSHRPPGTGSIDRLRRGLGALALALQGDVDLFHVGVALAISLLVFELLGRAFSRWSPSKDPNDHRD